MPNGRLPAVTLKCFKLPVIPIGAQPLSRNRSSGLYLFSLIKPLTALSTVIPLIWISTHPWPLSSRTAGSACFAVTTFSVVFFFFLFLFLSCERTGGLVLALKGCTCQTGGNICSHLTWAQFSADISQKGSSKGQTGCTT